MGRVLTALKGYADRRAPGYMVFFVTPFCACRCKMCFNMDAILNASKRDVLTLEEIERIARQWPGLHQLNFSGGEPLSRKDFPEVMQLFYEHSGTRFFTIPTSSSHPKKFEEQVRRACELCPDAWIRITQSVDGIGELHDEIRQRKGLFDNVVEFNATLAELCDEYSNLSVGLTTVFCKFNHGHNYELLNYAYKHLKFTDLGSLFVRGKTPEPGAKDFEAAEYVAYQTECIRRRREKERPIGIASRAFAAVNHCVAQYVIESVSTNDYIMPCQAGRRMVVLDDEGNVQPCEMLDYLIKEGTATVSTAELGNVRDFGYDIKALMGTATAKRVAKEIVDTKCHCTYECAMAVNTIYNYRTWPRIVKNFFALS